MGVFWWSGCPIYPKCSTCSILTYHFLVPMGALDDTYHIYILHYIIFFNFLFQFGLLQVPNHFHYIGNQSQIKSCWKNKTTTNQKLRWLYNDENKKCVQSQILVCLDATKLWRFLKKFLCGKYDNIKWRVWQKTQVKKILVIIQNLFSFFQECECVHEGQYFSFINYP